MDDGAGDGEFASRQLHSDGVFNTLHAEVATTGLAKVAPLSMLRHASSSSESSQQADPTETSSCTMVSRG